MGQRLNIQIEANDTDTNEKLYYTYCFCKPCFRV